MESGTLADASNPVSRAKPKETPAELYEKLSRQKEHSERTGTWFWPHLEPIANPPGGIAASSPDGEVTSVKLQCLHCHQYMAASNPSRTATEHLRSGCCRNFKEKHVRPFQDVPLTFKRPHAGFNSWLHEIVMLHHCAAEHCT